MERIRSANPGMQVLDARDDITLRAMEAHSHDDEEQTERHHREADGAKHRQHDDGHDPDHDKHAADAAHVDEPDPHVWTSLSLVKHIVGMICDKLSELDPAHAVDFARNHDAFVAELNVLDRELHALLDPPPNRRFMVFHPAWGYFADSYALTQVPIEREVKEPKARALVALIDQAKQEKIKVVFVQPQFDKRHARQVAQAIGGVVVTVYPLTADYVDNLRRVGRQFAQAMKP